MSESKSLFKPGVWSIWPVIVSLVLGLALILAAIYDWPQLSRWTARFVIALVWTAFLMLVVGRKASGFAGIIMIWISVVIAFFV